jgi:hypothetical protein
MSDGREDGTEKSWVDAELEDSFDEELEMEIDDLRVARELKTITDQKHKSTLDRRTYFRELLRLQSELVRMQDWVMHTGYKLVVIFEGRDAAGKGGVIKRVVQRLNPRTCRVVALPAPTEREKTQWYFQRYVPHLPAAGEIVLVGLLLLLLSYLAIAWFVAGRTPRRFLGAAKDVMLLAFSTSSSASVMPLSLSTTEEKLGVRPAVARFVIPLGTTINMGGTALYQGVATLFLAQVFGIELGVSGILLVTAMATGAAIGSPGTPGVGIVVLATILTSVGIPPSGIAIILGVDRLLDMCRTVVNVTGDMTACVTIDHLLLKSAGVEEPHLGKVATPAMHAPEPADSTTPPDTTGPSKPG